MPPAGKNGKSVKWHTGCVKIHVAPAGKKDGVKKSFLERYSGFNSRKYVHPDTSPMKL